MTQDIFTFIISGVFLMAAGIRLAKDGDAIAESTGIGGLWIGAVVLALATSLPELVTDVTAASRGFIDLALGEILGSGMSNMMILGLIDIVFVLVYTKRMGLLKNVSGGHIGSASLAITLTAIAALFIVLPTDLTVLNIGIGALIIAAAYPFGVWLLFRQANHSSNVAIPMKTTKPLSRSFIGIALSTILIFVAAPPLALSAQNIAVASGLGATFFGTLFLAFFTSTPELIVAITALQMGALDLAVGNLFGSNAFNIFILFFVDIAFRGGSLLASVETTHLVTALFLIAMMGVGLASVALRGKKRNTLLMPDSIALVALYIIGIYTVYAIT